jgi:hypothetical protein
LENLSWRVWTRETFCCDPVSSTNATTPAISIASRSSEGLDEVLVPSLSGSVDSQLESESDQTPSTASTFDPLGISRPQIHRQDSVSSRNRGRERHITPDDLEKMVITIKEKKDLEPITLNIQPYSPPTTITILLPQEDESAATPLSSLDSVANPSIPSLSFESATCASERRTTSVVRGFWPSHVSSSYGSIPLLIAPSSFPIADIVTANTSQGPQPEKRAPMFALGGSSGENSLSEQTESMENNMKSKKKAMLSFGGSSNEDESSFPAKMQRPQSALFNNIQRPPIQQMKQTSFQEEVAARTSDHQQYSDDVFETDEEDIDESVIDDDDDSSDWEDAVEETGSIDGKSLFQRVDSRPHLTTRRSLITTMLHQKDRAAALTTPALQRSRTTSPNGPSLAASPDSDGGSLMIKQTILKSIAEIPRSSGPAPQPIIRTTSNEYHQQLAVSPRTTRRNMLAAELTVSLRQHLLWERQQKSRTANAVLKRRHTAHDVAKLKQYPDKVHMGQNGGEIHASWNQYLSTGLGEYHSKGW